MRGTLEPIGLGGRRGETVEVLRQLSASGHSLRKIAKITGLGKSTVGDLLKGKYGLSTGRSEVVTGKITRYQTQQELVNLHKQGLSVRQIARIAGIGKSTAHDVIRGKTSLSVNRAGKVATELSRGHGMKMLTADGFKTVMPMQGRDWTLLGQHARALQKYLETGNPGFLLKFDGKSVKTTAGEMPLVTDPTTIKRLARQGATDVDDLVIGGSPGKKRARH